MKTMGFFSRLRASKTARFIASAAVVAQTMTVGLAGTAVAATVPTTSVDVSSVGFVLSGTYSIAGGQPTGAGQLKNGNVGAFPEGACIPMLFSVKNKSASAGDISFSPVYDYSSSHIAIDDLYGLSASGNPTAITNLNGFTYTNTSLASTTFSTSGGNTVTATVSGAYSGNSSGTSATTASDTSRHYNMTLANVAAGDTVWVTLCAKLGVDASQYNGASLSVRTAQYGAENVPIPVNQLLVLPSITISKTVVGGSAVASDFSFNVSPGINGVSAYSIPVGQTSVTINNVSPDGSYTVTENGLTGYTFSSGTGTNCTFSGSTATATVAAAKTPTNATCSFTNTARPLPQLTVIKHVINNNGGGKSAADFTMSVTATSPSQSSFAGAESPGTTVTLSPGTYSVEETDHTGYSETKSTGCSGTLDYGQSATCTITNDDIAPTLTLVKSVTKTHGGTAGANDFGISVNGTTVTSGTVNTETANTALTINEAGKTGYHFVSLTGTGCPSTLGGTITLSPGQNATCTITNADDAPTLTVIKHVVNGTTGGSGVAGDFTMNVTGTNVSSRSFAGSEAGTAVTLDAGSYGVTEGSHSGYTVSYSGDCSGTIAVGDSKTCTVTNTAIEPTLTITKTLDYQYGGTAGIGDFVYQITDSQNRTITVLAGVATQLPVGSYVVSEGTMPFGYTQESIGGDCSSFGAVTLALADTKTCAITNQDNPATLTVVKTVNNNHGGNLGASSFTMHIKSGSTDAVTPFSGNASGSSYQLSAGTYTVSEDDPSSLGYTQTSVVCDGQTTSSVTLTVGQSKTCTITNEDVAPTITLTKNVTNNNGGTAGPNDFGLSVGGDAVNSGDQLPVTANTPVALDEAGLDGYSFVSITGDAACPSVLGGTVTLLPGQNVSCTINNDDIAPKLTLTKVVLNTHGGLAETTDWTLSATPSDNTLTTISGPGGFSQQNAQAGVAYTLSESTGPDGYSAGDWNCNGGNLDGANLTLSLADDVTCTITNSDTQPTLTVIKHVDNGATGATGTASDFTMNVDGTTPSQTSFNGDENGTAVTMDAGSFNVTEGDHAGYDVSYDGCNGTIAVGDSKTCTVTNTAVMPTLTINKHLTTSFDGNLTANDFVLFATDSGNQQIPMLNGLASELPIGTYTVGEDGQFGYQQVSITCDGQSTDTITLALGDNKSCTISNTDLPASITVAKFHDRNADGFQDQGEEALSGWTITLNQTSGQVSAFAQQTKVTDQTGQVTFDNLSAGTYTVGEQMQSGWVQSQIVCGEENTGGNVSVNVGDEAFCTIGNYQPAIHLVKSVTPGTGTKGDVVTYTFTVTNPGDTPLSDVKLTDNLLDPASITGPSGDTNHDGLLDPTETWTYTAKYTIPSDQDVLNTATVLGTDTGPGKGNVTDTSQATVDVGSVLGASTGEGGVTELPRTGVDSEGQLLFAFLASTAAYAASMRRQRRRQA